MAHERPHTVYVVTLRVLRNIEVHDIYGRTLLIYDERIYSVC